ncbi:MAG: hypothetical protein JWQ07_5743 [Ramlibacter sp.]|nr:hypothetical protein [Ramlibacter sp.]
MFVHSRWAPAQQRITVARRNARERAYGAAPRPGTKSPHLGGIFRICDRLEPGHRTSVERFLHRDVGHGISR